MTREAREAVAAMRAGVRGVLGGGTDAEAWEEEWEEEWKEEWEDVAPDDVGGGDGGGRVSEIPPPEGHRPARPDSSEHVVPTSPLLPAGRFTTQSTIEVRETPENALALANLRNACRGARRRSVPALAAALALLAKLAPEEEAGEAGVSAAARAATLNELAAVKRDLVDWLGRCRSIGIEEAEAKTRDEKRAGRRRRRRFRFERPRAATAGTTPALWSSPCLGRAASRTSREATPPAARRGHPKRPAGVRAGRPPGTRAETPTGRARARDERERPPRAVLDGEASRRGFRGGAAAGLAGSPSSAAPGSAAARARRLFASREASAHNASVMRELGESGVERRDGVTGFGDAVRRRDEARAGEDAARALAEREARDAKRRRNEPTPQQRIQAKLNQMKRRGKR